MPRRPRGSRIAAAAVLALAALLRASRSEEPRSAAPEAAFRAGAHAIDITPEKLPVLINGGMTSRSASEIVDRLHARCLVLDDGALRLAIAVADSCMFPRDLLDEAKRLASERTGIPPERMLISATHTHSAPAAAGCLGTDPDEAYRALLPERLARGIELAAGKLRPARAGWGVGKSEKYLFCRRWLMKPGTARSTPFSGRASDAVQMNPGHQNPDAIRQTGPVDPEIAILSILTLEGAPLALLASYSTHYAGAPAVSADYFGVFCERMGELLGAGGASPPFVAMLANGTSGDANCIDFSKPRQDFDRFTVAEEVARAAFEAWRKIEHRADVSLAMAEKRLELAVRMPAEEEVERARAFLAERGALERLPQTVDEVYARETMLLSRLPPVRELKLQAIRIGELAVAAIPCEVYGSTGLAIKKESPLRPLMNISLANGCEGYIPPPDQHELGGYTTWRARTSALEVEAEPKIRAAVLELLRKVAGERGEVPARE
jgi:neutral ceramidase